MNKNWKYVPFCDAVEICDTLRKPINSKERAARITGKTQEELYPYYGATGIWLSWPIGWTLSAALSNILYFVYYRKISRSKI